MLVSNRLAVRSTVVLLAAGFLVLAGVVGLTVWLGERAQVLFGDVIEARDIRGLTVELRNGLQTAESSQRGYIATSNEIYLAPYDRAKAQALRQLSQLQRTRVQKDSGVLLERLSATIASKIDEMDRSIALKNSRQDEQAMALLRTNRGKALMDEADVYLSGIIRQTDERLTTGVEEQLSNASMLRWISIVGGIAIVALVGGVVVTLHRYASELMRARDEVRQMNMTLEERVAQRTADLATARDRAEVLLAEVNHRVANSLSLIGALVRLQGKTVKDQTAKDALDETRARIDAVSLVHKRLYSSGDTQLVALEEYLSGLLDHLQASMRNEGLGASLRYELEPLQLGIDSSINLGVVLAEWVTNAFKYAYSDQHGEVRVKLRSREDGRGELIVEDDGIGRKEGSVKGTGLGSRIAAAMASSMKGEIEYLARQPGTAARLIFPLQAQGARGT